VAGALGGPDRLAVRSRDPWSRIAAGLDLGYDAGYRAVLDALVDARRTGATVTPATGEAAAAETDVDLRSLGLPAVGDVETPTITLGLAAVPASTGDVRHGAGRTDGGVDAPGGVDAAGDVDVDVDATRWLPVRGSLAGSDGLRLSLPARGVEGVTAGTPLTLALGVPPAALVAATARWVGESGTAAPRVAAALASVSVAPTAAGPVPADSEVLVAGRLRADPAPVPEPWTRPEDRVDDTGSSGDRRRDGDGAGAGGGAGKTDPPASATRPAGPTVPWEHAVRTATALARVETVRIRPDPIVPISPTGAPMADGRVLLSVVEAARLYGRVNNYWGVAPVEWVALPAETGLGICLVASEVLYAGFEWQLANTLFSFSQLFDKVVVLDTETAPMDLARAFDDVWVKAHPGNDWEFSDSAAPAASAPHYRRNGETGANVYVNAAWDPRWDEEYIAPRVTFEATYPADLRAAVRESWVEMGFEHGPEYEPGGRRGDGTPVGDASGDADDGAGDG
jgi:4-hydroxy-3-polyprenylbenzoate decarboxylase